MYVGQAPAKKVSALVWARPYALGDDCFVKDMVLHRDKARPKAELSLLVVTSQGDVLRGVINFEALDLPNRYHVTFTRLPLLHGIEKLWCDVYGQHFLVGFIPMYGGIHTSHRLLDSFAMER